MSARIPRLPVKAPTSRPRQQRKAGRPNFDDVTVGFQPTRKAMPAIDNADELLAFFKSSYHGMSGPKKIPRFVPDDYPERTSIPIKLTDVYIKPDTWEERGTKGTIRTAVAEVAKSTPDVPVQAADMMGTLRGCLERIDPDMYQITWPKDDIVNIRLTWGLDTADPKLDGVPCNVRGDIRFSRKHDVVLGRDDTREFRTLLTNSDGKLLVDSSASTQPVSASSLPLPTGASTEATLSAVKDAVEGTVSVSATSLPLPTGAATETTLSAVKTAVEGTLDVQATSLPLPTGAATETTLAGVKTAVEGTLDIQAASLPLPTGAATEATLADVKNQLVNPLPLPNNAAKETTLDAFKLSMENTVATEATLDTIRSTLQAPLPLPTGAATETSLTTMNSKFTTNSTLVHTGAVAAGTFTNSDPINANGFSLVTVYASSSNTPSFTYRLQVSPEDSNPSLWFHLAEVTVSTEDKVFSTYDLAAEWVRFQITDGANTGDLDAYVSLSRA
ncbi:hypothetical protein PTSG_03893 [Salpingoeca rosetta]|uniref:Uncharacterized protein n=1 Tax=Salpingoeca rosetta (strain ATCC 50818 / BSB-021) TaxID=946362 RepID=F2U5P7_SALR5|nr:uncharacterized protein PTSG_03893 [Salpingoeca rosetta]EGD83263.1 hypothetical protein PTSG_03893 [Salpingoeca rosetta]|eukprot:XP_004995627.1 hypothetical protein PTSG_03893 [Salpingoeca rosetta]